MESRDSNNNDNDDVRYCGPTCTVSPGVLVNSEDDTYSQYYRGSGDRLNPTNPANDNSNLPSVVATIPATYDYSQALTDCAQRNDNV